MLKHNLRAVVRSNPPSTIHHPKSGFTLVELLVVITIIGILISLLLPAVQAAREAARRLQCGNNLKQAGLAVLQYEATYQIFPPALQLDPSDLASLPWSNMRNYRPNWVALVLPYMEQQPLYDILDKTQYLTTGPGTRNAVFRSTRLPTMLCPSDSFNQTPFNGSKSAASAPMGDGWARGNYAANGALGVINYSTAGASDYWQDAGPKSGWASERARGVMGANTSVTMAQIRDGASNTAMLGEIRAGVAEVDIRGTWAMGDSASSLWAHGSMSGDANGPNSPALWGDNTRFCAETEAVAGGQSGLLQMNMSCYIQSVSNQQGARSLHPNGVHVCLADGSVHWIGDFINIVGNIYANPPVYSVWDRLMLSADGMPIPGDAY